MSVPAGAGTGEPRRAQAPAVLALALAVLAFAPVRPASPGAPLFTHDLRWLSGEDGAPAVRRG